MAVIQHKRGTAAAIKAANPKVAAGETIFEVDTGRQKTGSGTTENYNSLEYDDTHNLATVDLSQAATADDAKKGFNVNQAKGLHTDIQNLSASVTNLTTKVNNIDLTSVNSAIEALGDRVKALEDASGDSDGGEIV